jgi:hypothetical protein
MRKFILGLIVGIVLAGTTVALASIPSADGTIHGCRATKGGSLRVIDADAGQTCGKDEAALTWNQTGPQGPAGPEGPQGPAGPPGPAGTVPSGTVYGIVYGQSLLTGAAVQGPHIEVDHECQEIGAPDGIIIDAHASMNDLDNDAIYPASAYIDSGGSRPSGFVKFGFDRTVLPAAIANDRFQFQAEWTCARLTP